MTVPGLFGLEGELVSLRIRVDPKHLEDLLEALALPGQVTVEFPAYSARLSEVGDAIRNHGFNPESLEVSRILV